MADRIWLCLIWFDTEEWRSDPPSTLVVARKAQHKEHSHPPFVNLWPDYPREMWSRPNRLLTIRNGLHHNARFALALAGVTRADAVLALTTFYDTAN